MITQLHPDLAGTPNREFSSIVEDARVERAAKALEANGMTVLRASNAAEAKRIVLDLIPEGSEVQQGASETLAATSQFVRESGAWTARHRPMRSAGSPPRRR